MRYIRCRCSEKYPARPCQPRVLIPDARFACGFARWHVDTLPNRNVFGVRKPASTGTVKCAAPSEASAHFCAWRSAAGSLICLINSSWSASAVRGDCRLLELPLELLQAGTNTASHYSSQVSNSSLGQSRKDTAAGIGHSAAAAAAAML